MRSVSARVFRAVCVAISLIMLLLTLICRVEIMHAEQNISALEKNISLAESTAELLTVRNENRISLSEIERRAVEELGMHRPTAEQLFFDTIQ